LRHPHAYLRGWNSLSIKPKDGWVPWRIEDIGYLRVPIVTVIKLNVALSDPDGAVLHLLKRPRKTTVILQGKGGIGTSPHVHAPMLVSGKAAPELPSDITRAAEWNLVGLTVGGENVTHLCR